jgi:hypothetical protein
MHLLFYAFICKLSRSKSICQHPDSLPILPEEQQQQQREH